MSQQLLICFKNGSFHKGGFMKDKLIGALGGFGFVVWYVISVLYSFAPLLFLRFSFIVDLILIIIMSAVPLLGEVVRFALYVWAFTIVIRQPIDVFSIIFFVFAALYLFTTVIPMIAALFSSHQQGKD